MGEAREVDMSCEALVGGDDHGWSSIAGALDNRHSMRGEHVCGAENQNQDADIGLDNEDTNQIMISPFLSMSTWR